MSQMGAMTKTPLAIKVGAAIRQARKQRGMVMRQIAEHNETDVAAVGNWETGRNLPKTENLLKTAAFLRVDPVALGRGEVGIDLERLLQDRADLLARVERAVGILEHHLHLGIERLVAAAAERFAVQCDAAGRDRCQPGDGPQQRRLA